MHILCGPSINYSTLLSHLDYLRRQGEYILLFITLQYSISINAYREAGGALSILGGVLVTPCLEGKISRSPRLQEAWTRRIDICTCSALKQSLSAPVCGEGCKPDQSFLLIRAKQKRTSATIFFIIALRSPLSLPTCTQRLKFEFSTAPGDQSITSIRILPLSKIKVKIVGCDKLGRFQAIDIILGVIKRRTGDLASNGLLGRLWIATAELTP